MEDVAYRVQTSSGKYFEFNNKNIQCIEDVAYRLRTSSGKNRFFEFNYRVYGW
jgi:hypothetical protein